MSKTTTPNNTAGTKRPRRMARPAEPDSSLAPAQGDAAITPPLAASADAVVAPEPAFTPTKAGMVLGLLRREGGATLPELVAATGWQPHTTRAHLTGLRKKGHAIERTRRDDAPCYRVVVEVG